MTRMIDRSFVKVLQVPEVIFSSLFSLCYSAWYLSSSSLNLSCAFSILLLSHPLVSFILFHSEISMFLLYILYFLAEIFYFHLFQVLVINH